MDETLLAAMRESMRRTNEQHAQQIVELKRSIASQQELLRDLAGAAMRLVEINAPRDPADTIVI